MTEIGERALNSPIAPIAVLCGHAHDQIPNLPLGPRSARATMFAAIVFVGDQPPVPSQKRVGCHDRGHFSEHATTDLLAFRFQASALVVIEK